MIQNFVDFHSNFNEYFLQNSHSGDKKSFNAALTMRCMKEAPKVKQMPKEDIMRGIELLVGKFTGNEVVTGAEIKAFFEEMMKKFPSGR